MTATAGGGFYVWANIASAGTCKFCKLPVIWRTTTRGKSLPFNGVVAPLHTQVDDRGRKFELLSREDLHLATCKKRKPQFQPARGTTADVRGSHDWRRSRDRH